MKAAANSIAAIGRHSLRCQWHATEFCALRSFSTTPARSTRSREFRIPLPQAKSNTVVSEKLPSFQQSSSPELDDLLAMMRDKIFLPGYLTPAQRKLVRKRKFASQLEHDPTFANVGGEEIQLHSIDVIKDVPGTFQSLQRVLELAESNQDWVSVLAVMEGLNNAGLQKGVRSGWKEKFIRKACDQGRGGIVLQALQQVERNSLSLKDEGVRFQAFNGIHRCAKQAEWSEEALDDSIRWCIRAISLLELDGHCGSGRIVENDGRSDPLIIGVTLDLVSRRQQLEPNASDRSRDVQRYLSRLLDMLKQQETELVNPPPMAVVNCLNVLTCDRRIVMMCGRCLHCLERSI